ncbi:hypothetical protein F4779DRAFT_42922 [Xylariaceae sp. FL0662B]|nr:hypothetical protein F4779DRAFT_42922 [Xylariaceae sp. FL0662B]
MAADDPSSNPFIRFKHHVDSNVQRGLQTVFGTYNTTRDDHTTAAMSTTVPGHTSSQSEDSLTSDSGIAAAQDVYAWALSSPYSPLHLQHLPQPRPRDAPANDPCRFTFRDAFEDLLTVNSGLPLPDIQRLSFAKHLEHFQHSLFGLRVDDWVADLGRRGLWDAYFPRWIAPMDGFALHQRWELAHSPFAFPDEPHFDNDLVGPPRLGALWKEVVSKLAGESYQHQHADSEADLYEAIRSRFALDGPMRRGSAEGIQGRAESLPDDVHSTDAPVSRIMETRDGGRILRTVERRIRDGQTEVTTTTQHYDMDGNLTAQDRTTSISRIVPYKLPGEGFVGERNSVATSAEITTSDITDEGDRQNGRDGRKSSGWFWTK